MGLRLGLRGSRRGQATASVTLLLSAALIALVIGSTTYAHDVTTHVTWNREISRIVFTRCAACHHPGGSAFSLMSYAEANPWANAIKEQVLRREMPPWGAVKGFGSFRNDQSLIQGELDLFEKWVNGGAPEGNPDDLPTRPRVLLPPVVPPRAGELVASGAFTFPRPFMLDGFWARNTSSRESQITVQFPDGRVEPLVWLRDYSAKYDHPFLLRKPLSVPVGAVLHGLPADASLVLLPATSH
jgi:hypothetical protein